MIRFYQERDTGDYLCIDTGPPGKRAAKTLDLDNRRAVACLAKPGETICPEPQQ
jgi:hypothetical protein